jgi:osmotically-inducible protein OsmY
MRFILTLPLLAILAGHLTACVPVVAGGAAGGALMATDRRSSGAFVDDQTIIIKAESRINTELGDKIHVNVTSYNRNVLLTGEAKDDASKAKAETIAKGIETVSHVSNELTVGFISSISDRAKDTYLTSKVKARMVSENRFPPNYVKVVTEASVVYLMGLVTQKEADDATEIARSTDGVTKVVKIFEYIK